MAAEKSGAQAPADTTGTTTTTDDKKPTDDKKTAETTAEKPRTTADTGAEKPRTTAGAGKDDKTGTSDEGTQTETGTKDGAVDDGKPKPPEKYALTIPDDAKTWITTDDLKEIEVAAREAGWTNEQAQEAVEKHADRLIDQSAAFRAATEADETYGGDHLAETQRLAQSALDKLRPAGTPQGDAFRGLLGRSGYGNKLEVVAFLADLGKLMAEDSPAHAGGGGGAPKKDAASVLYPKMAQG